MNTQGTHSALSKSFVPKNYNKQNHLRIFLKIDKIVSAPNSLTTAYGINLVTQEYIAIRLNTVDEYANDLLVENPNLGKDNAMQKARQSYVGSNSRESLNDKRDKRRALYLSFDRCQLIGQQNNIPLYRSHWSELISSNHNAQIFEGLAHLHVKKAVTDPNTGVVLKKSIAHLNIIQQRLTLNISEFERNTKALKSALATTFNNGMRRTGYAVLEIIDNITNEVIAETFIFQKSIKEVLFNPNTGLEYNATRPAEYEDSIHEFMNNIHEGAVNQFIVERDFLRVLMPLYFNIPLNKDAFCQSGDEYLAALRNLHKAAINNNLTLKLTCIHQVFIGAERANFLLKNIDKGLIKAYTNEVVVDGNTRTIRRYIPTLFALQFHTDSENPYVAFNIISNNSSGCPLKPLNAIDDDLFGIKYRKLN